MDYRISYYQEVIDDDIPTLPETVKKRIKQAIDERLLTHPDMYGKPLRKGLSGFRKLRIGDWRLIYCVQEDIVKIFIIGHRSKVYESIFHRLSA